MLNKINFPKSRSYRTGSDHEPFEFYLNCLFHSKQFDLLLGYFSSAAISVLSLGFAKFIYDGGKLRIVANQILSEEDRNAILLAKEADIEPPLDLKDIKTLKNSLDEYGEHFFKCLAYLISTNSIEIKIVKTKTKGIPHYKSGIFKDGPNKVSFQASCNFTAYGLLENAESLSCYLSMDEQSSIFKIKEDEEYFEQIFNEEVDHLEYIGPESIEVAIKTEFGGKDLNELLIEENELIKKKNIKAKDSKLAELLDDLDWEVEKIAGEPRFPYSSSPRPYQIDAYNNWKNNHYSGVFAMATGTGKTITSLNCLLNEYKLTNEYKAIILVPSIALLNQWELEVKQFNFKRVVKIGGGHNWEPTLGSIVSNKLWKKKENFILIVTYGSFTTDRFQKYFSKIQDDLILIADEAHNIGAPTVKKLLPTIRVPKRIGLSATPKRIYDPEGTDALNKFFNDQPPYCYEFGMEKALNEGFLTEYKYTPFIVELTEEETDEYIDISKKLLRFFDTEKGEFKKDTIVETLLLRRKSIIHKAHNKISTFTLILKELEKRGKSRYVFTYVPEGYIRTEDGVEEKLLDQFLYATAETTPYLTMNSYTNEDKDLNSILRGFSEGKIDILFAMKMLDEGVDIPRAEVGIFCASTGNPRQFIQRRGRLLRKHKDKSFASIYDMVVIPHQDLSDPQLFNMERNMVKNELQRVAYFASLSMNYYDSKDSLENVCQKYELNLNEIINEL
ncbi:Superfamily II DNA or RNA helicase [Sphingobacterium nematocida]|uniref:Superfamily II DNA or RNA helicase n=1 Tax=Sphingobacterium nematocida TaxID=1513896 RepID=A0A1T5B0W2_9SPHI|nr:DEAD/DEAH box helicase family protein [Sphingobacterium nematocida]SKB40697.1 Superfamily II DNA or RNA helicase [Sphingobacterium nematocida]